MSLNGIDFQLSSTEASFAENFERFTVGRLSFYPGTVKLFRSPGKAGGFPVVLTWESRLVVCELLSNLDHPIV